MSLDAARHLVAHGLVGLEELLVRHVRLEPDQEDDPALHVAPAPAASFSRRSLMTLICSLVLRFMYSSACSSLAGASGFIEKSWTQRMLVPPSASSKYHSMFMYSNGPVSIRRDLDE